MTATGVPATATMFVMFAVAPPALVLTWSSRATFPGTVSRHTRRCWPPETLIAQGRVTPAGGWRIATGVGSTLDSDDSSGRVFAAHDARIRVANPPI